MTKLSHSVTRETAKSIQGRNVIVTLASCGSQSEARIGLRLKGKRTQYVCTLSAIYTMAALWHGNAEKRAKKEARANGVKWAIAKRKFVAENSI